jgi:glycerophosphoryl diester phosphodiesterase
MSRPLIIGHRGASAVAPENTIAAFKAAIATGADGIEFDVRLTRDGVPVVIHDETLRRTGGVRGRVSQMTLAELSNVDVGSWFDRQFEKERIPGLAQLFELFQSNNLILYLEMKSQASEQTRLAEACCRLIDEHLLKNRVIFECFELAALETVKHIDSTLKTAALFQPPSSFILKRAKAIGASELALHHRLATKQLVQKARLADLRVVTWTVDDPAWVSRAEATGIDALITNNPTALIAAREAMRAV